MSSKLADVTRVALYLRQSINLAEGIERQRTRCIALAHARGWEVVATFEDNDTSATKPRGPKTAWGQMLARAEAGDFEVIAAVDMDRLLRGTGDLLTLTATGAKVVTTDGEIDLASAEGQFRATLLAGLAQFETRRKHERSSRADESRAAQGVPRPGVRAFGYETDQITARESEATWIRWAVEQIIGGKSLYSVSQEFNARGVLTSQGKTWRPTLLSRTLKNPRNAGIFIREGVRQPVSAIASIISEDQHEQLVAVLAEKSDGQKRGPKVRENWLAGLILCNICGSPMRGRNVNRGGKLTRSYLCEQKIYGRANGERHRSITAHLVEDRMPWELFVALLAADPQSIAEGDETARAHTLRQSIAEATRERTAAMELYLLPGADRGFVSRRLTELEAHATQLQAELDALRAASARLTVRAVLEQAELIDDIKTGWGALTDRFGDFERVWDGLTIDQKRELVRSTVRVSITEGNRGDDRLAIDSLL